MGHPDWRIAVLVHALQDCRTHHERGVDCVRHCYPRAQAAVEGVWQGTLKEAERHSDVEFFDGTMCHAEIHWYEAHGIGAKEYKIKRIVE